ncbi:MAG: hypothetical protein QF464_06470, partial [Myxococcota bacterium]|nr:hypothetical protein [Myxococcota bacterium]
MTPRDPQLFSATLIALGTASPFQRQPTPGVTMQRIGMIALSAVFAITTIVETASAKVEKAMVARAVATLEFGA